MRPTPLLASLSFLCLFLPGWAGSPRPAWAEDAPQPVVTWDRVHLAGGYAGFVRTTVRRHQGEHPVVETEVHTELNMVRMGQSAQVVSTTTTRETPAGGLLRIEVRQRMSAQESHSVFEFTGAALRLTTRLMGGERTVEQDLGVEGELVGPAAMARTVAGLAGTQGESVTELTYMSDLQAVVAVTSTSRGEEEVRLSDGNTRRLTRVEGRVALAKGGPLPMDLVSWIDAEGEPLATRVSFGGMLIESYRVPDEASARAPAAEKEGGATTDVFEASIVREPGFVPVPRRLEAATILLTPRRPGADVAGLSGPGHEVRAMEDGRYEVRAVRRVPPEGRRGRRPLAEPPPALAEGLGPSSLVQSDAEEIRRIAAEVVGDEPCAWTAAQRLERWVHAHIDQKGMGVAFASALEVCRSREGDCTEHAVLFAALARAAGIPARVVMGLEYLMGIWGGHAWNEVWIEGEWYPLDATNGLGFVDPLHLPMARLTMQDGAGAEYAGLLGSLGNFDVDVVEVVRDGRRIAVDDPALVTTTADRHVNRVLGLCVSIPAGYAPRAAPASRSGLTADVLELHREDAPQGTIHVRVFDAPAQGGVPAILGMLGQDAGAATPGTLDERPALTVGAPDGAQRRVFVEADGHVWMFSFKGPEAAGAEAFDAFLASVDLDVR